MNTIPLLKDAHTRLKRGYKTIICAFLVLAAIGAVLGAVFALFGPAEELNTLSEVDSSSISFGISADISDLAGIDLSDYTGFLTTFSIISLIVGFITILLEQGLLLITLKSALGEQVSLKMLFSRFNDWRRIIWLTIVQFVLIWLWSLLFVIPGIIKAFSYSQSFYILLQDENISAIDAITKSRRMMKGHKANLFWITIVIGLLTSIVSLALTFIPFVGPIILAVAIALYIAPLLMVAMAIYYLYVIGANNPASPAAEPPVLISQQ